MSSVVDLMYSICKFGFEIKKIEDKTKFRIRLREWLEEGVESLDFKFTSFPYGIDVTEKVSNEPVCVIEIQDDFIHPHVVTSEEEPNTKIFDAVKKLLEFTASHNRANGKCDNPYLVLGEIRVLQEKIALKIDQLEYMLTGISHPDVPPDTPDSDSDDKDDKGNPPNDYEYV